VIKDKINRFLRFLHYLRQAKHLRGHGIHSPFAFDLQTNVIEEKYPYYCYGKIEAQREKLLADKRKIFATDYGTGKSRERKISEIAKKSLKNAKQAQLIFRIANAAHPCSIVELGASLGISTAYLASIDRRKPCFALEGCPQTAEIARNVWKKCNVEHINLRIGNIDDTLPELLNEIETLGFVFFDANHTREATLRYFRLCLPKVNAQTVFVFDDIHHSREMEEAWAEIIANEKVRVSFDLFAMGVVYFNPELQKQDYVLLHLYI
jgi:predicted O-methyltransferase YrrM